MADAKGTLAILCTSRSESTLLSREIERRYRVGEIRESLNPPQRNFFSRREACSARLENAAKGEH